MKGVNVVHVVGTLGQDPDVREAGGTTITTISVAVNEKWKDKNGDVQERCEWIRVKFFGRLAEIAGEYLKKGGQVYVQGKLRTDKYTDKENIERYVTDVIASEMVLLGGSKDRDDGDRQQRTEPQQRRAPSTQRQAAPREEEPFPDDDINF